MSIAKMTADDVRAVLQWVKGEYERNEAEEARQEAEAQREENEAARQLSEEAREQAENDRAQAENLRALAESARAGAETLRASAEAGRVSAESNRVMAEQGRASAESDRADAELIRQSNELARQEAELAREQLKDDTIQAIEDAEAAALAANEAAEAANEAASTAVSSALEAAGEAMSSFLEGAGEEVSSFLQSAGESLSSAISGAESATSDALEAAEDANDAADRATIQADRLEKWVHMGDYDPDVTYEQGNHVRYNGSTWMALQTTTGNVPDEGVYWTLVAQRGLDGLGSVSSVAGISPDLSGNVHLTPADLGAMANPATADLNMNTRNIFNINKLHFRTTSTLTISGGAITVSRGQHRITTPGGLAELHTIDGGSEGERVFLRILTSDNPVRVKAKVGETGNISLPNGRDILLTDIRQSIELHKAGSDWVAVSINGREVHRVTELNFETSNAALTISGGAITITQAYHTVDTEDSEASDELDVINGGSSGDTLILRQVNSNRDIIIRNQGGGTGNIRTWNSEPIVLNTSNSIVELMKIGDLWVVKGTPGSLSRTGGMMSGDISLSVPTGAYRGFKWYVDGAELWRLIISAGASSKTIQFQHAPSGLVSLLLAEDGSAHFGGSMVIPNGKALYGKDTSSVNRLLIAVGANDRIIIGDTDMPVYLQGNALYYNFNQVYHAGNLSNQTLTVIPNKPASDAGSTYPMGITVMPVSSGGVAAGWPTDIGVVITARLSEYLCAQMFIRSANSSTTNGQFYSRSWRSDAGWSDFRFHFTNKDMGSGSGLDADMVDGMHASTSATADTIVQRDASGNIRGNNLDLIGDVRLDNGKGLYAKNTSGVWRLIQAVNSSDIVLIGSADLEANIRGSSVKINGNVAWHAGNDGAGSGLDADLLDGQHASAFWTKSELGSDRTRKITISTSDPSGGADGDIWIQV